MNLTFAFLLVAIIIKWDGIQANLTSEEIFQVPIHKDAVDPKGRTVDEIIKDAGTDAATRAEAANNQQVSVQYDMLMDPVQYAMYYGNLSTWAGGAVAAGRYRWPKRIIPYEITEAFNDRQKEIIYGGMREWQEKTCIKFEPASPETAKKVGHRHHIVIRDGKGCSSYVGYNGWSHMVTLQMHGCLYHTTVLHELGHSIGLHHEQCRPDRDRHLKVLYENIQENYHFAFRKEYSTTAFDIPYDYCSIMQYGRNAFSKKWSVPSMLAKDFDYFYSLGRNKELQFSDAKVVNLMYKCNSHCPANPSCRSPCYVNHKCECECEREEAKCEKRPCDKYGKKEDCDKYRKILGILTTTTTPKPTTTTTPPPPTTKMTTTTTSESATHLGPKCVDSIDSCQSRADDGDCENDWRMKQACPKSCGLCSPCGDKNEGCQYFANRGDCDLARLWMYENCNKSCKLC